MCGIAGMFSYASDGGAVEPAELVEIRDSMFTRGPDAEGLWISTDRRMGLAHRRLSIIDLSAEANQPLWDTSGRWVISFNGELYNYQELRRSLIQDGFRFRTSSDTEVLLNLFARDGLRMFELLRGMFALSIWDVRERTLTLARDHFGIKPLYFCDTGKRVYFASQVRALRKSRLSLSASPAGHAGFLLWGFVPEPYTLFNEIRAVPPGHAIQFSDSGRRREYEYFSVTHELERYQAEHLTNTVEGEEARLRLAQAVNDSVQSHLMADVPVGIFLSAGIDSTIIAASASKLKPVGLTGVTLGFNEYRGTDKDETRIAAMTASTLGLTHHVSWTTREEFEHERGIILEQMDQPSCDGINSYFVSKAARSAGLKVALSGLGGDELFATYPSYTQIPRLNRLVSKVPARGTLGRALELLLRPLKAFGVPSKLGGILTYGGSLEAAYLLRRALYLPNEIRRQCDANFLAQGIEQLQTLRQLQKTVGELSSPRMAITSLELQWYMRSQLLRDTDWASMAHSVEVRVPFVDIDFFRAAGPALYRASPVSKGDLLHQLLPDGPSQVTVRRKTGFTVPVGEWLLRGSRNMGRGARAWSNKVFDSSRVNRTYLALVTDGYGGRGGIAKFNRDLLEAVAAYPHTRWVFGFPRQVVETVSRVPAKIGWDIKAAAGKLSFLRATLSCAITQRPSTLICGHINFVPWALFLRMLTGGDIVLFVHGIEAWTPHSSRLVRRGVKSIGKVVSVSNTTAERLRKWSNLSADRFAVLPNCVDFDQFKNLPETQTVRARYGLQDARVLLTLGRLAAKERYKGFDEVIEALPLIRTREPRVKYVIAGDGPDIERLRAKVEALGIADIVLFLGYLNEDEKPGLFAASDVYVMPSRGEGFGIVFLEALACGVPTIGSTVDGGREALLDGELGTLVNPDNTQELVEAILKALRCPKHIPSALQTFSKSAFERRVHAILDATYSELAQRRA